MRSASLVATTISAARSCSSDGNARTSKIVIERISARVFCPLPSMQQEQNHLAATNNDETEASPNGIQTQTPSKRGGNPVTIFKILSVPELSTTNTTAVSSQHALLTEECSKLASTCAWESVFVFPPLPTNSDISTTTNKDENTKTSAVLTQQQQMNMAFYMPTGKPVSFCARAAMGGAYAYFHKNNNKNNINHNYSDDQNDIHPVSFKSQSPTKEMQLNVLDIIEEKDSTNHVLPPFVDDDAPTTYIAAYKDDDNALSEHHQSSGTIALNVQNMVWQQEPIEQPTTLHRILREYHKVNGSTDCTLPMIEVLPTQQQWQEQNLDQYEPQILKTKYNKVIPLPTFVNSWVGDRKKTMVYINKDETLHQKILPPPSRAAEKHYPAACDSLQNTTGLYLFASKTTEKDRLADQREIKLDYPFLDPNNEDENVWECRQFPRQSGYSEDPATGVAAAALAISLRFCEAETQRIVGYDSTTMDDTMTDDMRMTKFLSAPSSKYEFYQGTAMQQPSYIVVDNIQMHSLVTQEEKAELPPAIKEELSVFKYAKTVDEENNTMNDNTNQSQSAIADKINILANKKDVMDMDDQDLEREAASADLFKDVEDDEIWEDDEEEEDDDDPASDTIVSPPPSSPPPPPKKDYRYHKHRGIVSFTLTGRIEVDAIEMIEI